ncbi:MAG: Ig-like domain-containing protein, partial [Candidatus Firestonebacteria bacterium]|nr:Ig-like domain-containing protein [Candidatus Firestonebacteria bacterium]
MLNRIHSNIKNMIMILFPLLFIFALSCMEKPNDPVYNPNLSALILSVYPDNGAVNVVVNTTITAMFSEAMDASSINANTFTIVGAGLAPAQIAGTVTYSNKIATFTPLTNLSYNITYTATITTGVKNEAGTGLAKDYTWSFTTELAPSRLKVNPISLAFSSTKISDLISISNIGGKPLTWSITDNMTWLTISPTDGTTDTTEIDDTISVTVDRTGLARGMDSGNIRITSNGGDSTIPVTMYVSNNPPKITSEPIIIAEVDKKYTYDIEAKDIDRDILIYSLTTSPAGMTIDSSSGLVSWIPASSNPVDVNVHVDDGHNGFADQSFDIKFIPSAPTNVTATAGDKKVTISWSSVSGATSYNIYWDTTSGVSKIKGTKIPGVTSPSAHTGRINGKTYFYVVTAVNSYGESSESNPEVSAIPMLSDTTPDQFVFIDSTNVKKNTLITSNIITVSGINTSTSISITGGQYSINGAAYTSSSGIVNNDNSVTVQQTSSGSFSTKTNAVLSIGGVFDTFSVTTIPKDATPANISSTKADGAYKAGEVIGITITFTESVNVIGTPQLTLETGTIDRIVNYTSGSGTNTLAFNYTVQNNDTSPDLDYISTAALALNGGTIKDTGGNNAVLTLPTPGGTGSLGFNKALVIDTTPPQVNFVSPVNNATDVAINTAITATFNEAMNASTITTTTFKLNNGAVAGTVTYSGTTATFTPTSNLAENTQYIATITTGVMDLAGNAINLSYTWSFTTGGAQTQGLVSYWKFDEGNEITAYDSSGNGNSGTINGATWVDGKIGKALYFDGVNDYFIVPNSASLNSTNKITIGAWIKLSTQATTGGAALIVKDGYHGGKTGYGFLLGKWSFSNQIRFELWNPWRIVDSVTPLDLDRWYYLTVTYDGNYMKIYINGELDNFLQTSGTINVGNNGILGMGPRFDDADVYWPELGQNIHGIVDEVSIYSIALSLNEINQYYQSVLIREQIPINITISDFINSGATYTNSTTVTLAISATDNVGVTAYYTSESSTQPLATNPDWINISSTPSYSANVSFVLSTGDGSKTVYVWFKDDAGNVSGSKSDSIILDTTRPIVISTNPLSNAINLSINTNITATFSEDMDSSSINLSISGGVTGIVSYDKNNRTATFTPSGPLAYNTEYTATITTGVKDLAGNAIASNYTWSFTTVQFAWIAIDGGAYHSIALRNDSSLWAWGRNNEKELGDGTYIDKSSPIQIGNDKNWIKVSAGMYISSALKSDSTLWMWGTNDYGQMGNGTKGGASIAIPTQVGTDANWRAVSNGNVHVIALKSNNTLWAWGENYYNQLGDGTTIEKLTPTQIGTDTNWLKISTGFEHNTAIKTNGTLWVWGRNYYGQLGDGTKVDKSVPTQIGTDTDWKSVAAGYEHTVAIKNNGTLWTWGRNNFGQLGIGTNQDTSIPIQVGTDTDWENIDTGYGYIIALKTDGTLWSWGWNAMGQLGNNVNEDKNIPAKIGTDIDWSIIACGWYHSFAVKDNGELWTFGYNTYGGLGLEMFAYKRTFEQVGMDTDWRIIKAGGTHSILLKNNGTLWSCGGNTKGELGEGSWISKKLLEQIGLDNDWLAAGAGERHTIILKSNGTLWGTGYNYYGQVGDGTVQNNVGTLKQIGTDSTWIDISLGDGFTIALKNDSTIWGWGRNYYGQLGIGTNQDTSLPTQIGTNNNWIEIATGKSFTLALKSDNTLWTWGYNEYGELGDGTTIHKNVPIQIGSDENWASISASGDFATALKSDGTRWAWGLNNYGYLGDGTTDNSYLPKQIDSGWTKIFTGINHTLALKSDGSLWGWGLNWNYQLGDTTGGYKINPVQIGTDTDWASISGGKYHSIATKSNGTLWATGGNSGGQLGDGTAWLNYPVKIGSPIILITGPNDSTQNVAIDKTISAKFSKPMDSTTIDINSFYISGGKTGTVTYNNTDNVVSFNLDNDLEYNSTYIATITTNVKDKSGNPIVADYTWSFKTKAIPAPQTLASGLNTPQKIATDLLNVYWTESDGGTIKKISIFGGIITTLASGENTPYGIAVDSTSVYWTGFSGGTINKINKNGGTVTTLASGLNQPYDIVVDSINVYWTEQNGGIVKKVGKDGGTVTILASGLNLPQEIAVDSINVYWTEFNGNTLKKVSINGGTVTTLASGLNGPWGIAIDSMDIYWTEISGGTVKKISINGGTVTTLASGLNQPYGIAVDSMDVYWVELVGGTVKKVSINGGTVTTLTSGLNQPYDIAIDSMNVYWTEVNDSS